MDGNTEKIVAELEKKKAFRDRSDKENKLPQDNVRRTKSIGYMPTRLMSSPSVNKLKDF